MYRRIMVVTSDQSWSDIPVKYAIALAAETGAELSILMVLTPPLIAGMSDVTACTLIVESIMDQSATALADIVVMAEQAGIAYTTRVRWGSTADAVLRTAEEDDCDLVIVGSHTYTWRSHRILRHVIKQLDHLCQATPPRRHRTSRRDVQRDELGAPARRARWLPRGGGSCRLRPSPGARRGARCLSAPCS